MLSARACLTGGHTRGAGRRGRGRGRGEKESEGMAVKGGMQPLHALFCCTSATFHCKPTPCIALLNIQMTWLHDRQRACLRWCRSAPRRWSLLVFCFWVTTSACLRLLPSCPLILESMICIIPSGSHHSDRSAGQREGGYVHLDCCGW